MKSADLEVQDVSGGCRIRLRVRPGGRVDAILGPHGGALKVSVKAPPERGKANTAVEALIAVALGIAAGRVTVTSGRTSPNKTVSIEGLDASAVRSRLAAL